MNRIRVALYYGMFGACAVLMNLSPIYAQEQVGMRPESVPQLDLPENAPPSVLKKLTFADSKIFPGTVHEISVLIPAQYRSDQPACVYLVTDGYRSREKPLIDGLIAGGHMPVTVTVFVTPGILPPPDGMETLGRRNRCLEYDGLGDSTACFFLEEILPFVEEKLDLNLSDSGNDRCIAGNSSGGICAFNAAWERPDAFRRVYATSPSFSAFRGGDRFPVLVRKTEAKPIRVYFATGTHDMENCAGDWFLADQAMAKALEFSGYEYMFRILEGRHSVGIRECYTEAMSFLWKDWPAPVQAGRSAPRVQDVIVPGEPWRLAGQGFQQARGAACNESGNLFFVDAAEDKIYCIDVDGNIEQISDVPGGADDLTVGPRGNLYSVSAKTGRVFCFSKDWKTRLIAENLFGHSVMATPSGDLYVADTGTVWLVKDGSATPVASGPKKPAGLALRPDQWLLAVADGASKWIYSYQADSSGNLINGLRYFWLHVPDGADDAGIESVCYAREGQLFAATRMGIQICADNGPTQVIMPMPDRSRVLSVCLGGRDGNILYAFCGNKIWSRTVKVHGVGAFSPWTAVKQSRL